MIAKTHRSSLRKFLPAAASTALIASPSSPFFIESDGIDIHTASTPGRIPKTLGKLQNGKKMTIVCWGDSVTVGGDISDPADIYVERFRQALLK